MHAVRLWWVVLVAQSVVVCGQVPREWDEWSQTFQRQLLSKSVAGPGPAPLPPLVVAAGVYKPFKTLVDETETQLGTAKSLGLLMEAQGSANSISSAQPEAAAVLDASLVFFNVAAAGQAAGDLTSSTLAYRTAQSLLATGPAFSSVDYLNTLADACKGLSQAMLVLNTAATLKKDPKALKAEATVGQAIQAMQQLVTVARSQNYLASTQSYQKAVNQASNCLASTESGQPDEECDLTVQNLCS